MFSSRIAVVKSTMKMYLEQRRQAMLQLHLNDQYFFSTKVRIALEIWRYIIIFRNELLHVVYLYSNRHLSIHRDHSKKIDNRPQYVSLEQYIGLILWILTLTRV